MNVLLRAARWAAGITNQ